VAKYSLLWKALPHHEAALKNSIQVHLVARHDHKPKAETQVRVASHQTSALKRNEALGERRSWSTWISDSGMMTNVSSGPTKYKQMLTVFKQNIDTDWTARRLGNRQGDGGTRGDLAGARGFDRNRGTQGRQGRPGTDPTQL